MVETGASQVFLAIDASRLGAERVDRIAREIIDDYHQAEPIAPGQRVYYPGERSLLTRRESMEKGVLADDSYWRQVQGQ